MSYRVPNYLPREYRPKYFSNYTKAMAVCATAVFVFSYLLTAAVIQ
jgi:hypothetical protein